MAHTRLVYGTYTFSVWYIHLLKPKLLIFSNYYLYKIKDNRKNGKKI